MQNENNNTRKTLGIERREYRKFWLLDGEVSADPFVQFSKWFADALLFKVLDAHAFHLSTSTPDGLPSGRIVLLKEATLTGFIFCTNYLSRKGEELDLNPHVALTFFWPQLERQIRIEGKAQKTSPQDSASYFQGRPRESQISAWASPQSEQIPNRVWLEEEYEKTETRFRNTDPIPAPEHWGGYIVIPNYFEFWQGRENRLHDRICFTPSLDPKSTPCGWDIERLAP